MVRKASLRTYETYVSIIETCISTLDSCARSTREYGHAFNNRFFISGGDSIAHALTACAPSDI